MKIKIMRKPLLLILFTALFLLNASLGQDSLQIPKSKKNTIRWNMTPLMFSSNNFTLGYERVLKNNKSVSLNAGLFLLSSFFKDDAKFYSIESSKRMGYTVTADFRFYLQKYNRQAAPAGVYIGPYISQYSYKFEASLFLNKQGEFNGFVDVDGAINMSSLGVQLGYQFIFWDRISLDLILIGPSLTYYYGKLGASVDVEIEEGSDAYEYIKEQIDEKYPWVKSLVQFDTIKTGGNFDLTAFGFRYVIQIGFRF
jgi:hypothetical protein